MRITLPHHHVHILVTRFNNATLAENRTFRREAAFDGCMYATPCEITERVPLNARCIVLEMNNETNTIVGIGLMLNQPRYKRFRVYTTSYYNNLYYRGKVRLDRDALMGYPAMRDVLRRLENVCFRGKDHVKRGQGITSIPEMKYRRHMSLYETYILMKICGENVRQPSVRVKVARKSIRRLHSAPGAPAIPT
jgi:hypothetical protein